MPFTFNIKFKKVFVEMQNRFIIIILFLCVGILNKTSDDRFVSDLIQKRVFILGCQRVRQVAKERPDDIDHILKKIALIETGKEYKKYSSFYIETNLNDTMLDFSDGIAQDKLQSTIISLSKIGKIFDLEIWGNVVRSL